jgi:hypothetical protein
MSGLCHIPAFRRVFFVFVDFLQLDLKPLFGVKTSNPRTRIWLQRIVIFRHDPLSFGSGFGFCCCCCCCISGRSCGSRISLAKVFGFPATQVKWPQLLQRKIIEGGALTKPDHTVAEEQRSQCGGSSLPNAFTHFATHPHNV